MQPELPPVDRVRHLPRPNFYFIRQSKTQMLQIAEQVNQWRIASNTVFSECTEGISANKVYDLSEMSSSSFFIRSYYLANDPNTPTL